MDKVSAYNFLDIYQKLGIDFSTLGCLMLSISMDNIAPFRNIENLYDTDNDSIATGKPHLSLLFGLLRSAHEYRPYIDELLKDWHCDFVTIDEVSFFDSPNPEKEPYYCIVAKVAITPELIDGHSRLQFLPHIDSFPNYIAHITIAYINRDNQVRDSVIDYYSDNLIGKQLKVTGLDYGREPSETNKSTHYCVSCKESKKPINVKLHRLSNNRLSEKGQCPDCNTATYRFVSNQ